MISILSSTILINLKIIHNLILISQFLLVIFKFNLYLLSYLAPITPTTNLSKFSVATSNQWLLILDFLNFLKFTISMILLISVDHLLSIDLNLLSYSIANNLIVIY